MNDKLERICFLRALCKALGYTLSSRVWNTSIHIINQQIQVLTDEAVQRGVEVR